MYDRRTNRIDKMNSSVPILFVADNRGLRLKTYRRSTFTTIDDCIQLAQELTARLHRDDCIGLAQELTACLYKLGDQKYPLGVRKGTSLRRKRKEVECMVNSDASKVVKAGGKTYFLDIKKTKEGESYLVITESRFQGEGKARERTTIVVFSETAKEFAAAVSEMVRKLA